MNPTDSQINEAICRWMGWKWLDHPDTIERTKTFTLQNKWVISPSGGLVFPHSAPNYLSDESPRSLLNEAEARLMDKQKIDYIDFLESECKCDGWIIMGVRERIAMVSATARQRATALAQVVAPEVFQ